MMKIIIFLNLIDDDHDHHHDILMLFLVLFLMLVIDVVVNIADFSCRQIVCYDCRTFSRELAHAYRRALNKERSPIRREMAARFA